MKTAQFLFHFLKKNCLARRMLWQRQANLSRILLLWKRQLRDVVEFYILKNHCHYKGELRTDAALVLHVRYPCLQGSVKLNHMSPSAFCSLSWSAPAFSISPHKAAGPSLSQQLPFGVTSLSWLANTRTTHNAQDGCALRFHIAAKLCPLSCCYNVSQPSTVFCLLFGCNSNFRYGSILPTILDKWGS